jgi:hypothetical protein
MSSSAAAVALIGQQSVASPDEPPEAGLRAPLPPPALAASPGGGVAALRCA